MAESKNNPTFNEELLSAYVDGELSAEERAVVEARLESDPSARELVAEMQSLSGTLRSLPREKLVNDIRAGVLSQIADKQVALPSPDVSWTRRLMWPALAIAAALMLMFVQGNEKNELGDVAQVEADRDRSLQKAGPRREIAAADDQPVFRAPATVSAPEADIALAPAETPAMSAIEPEVASEDSRLSGRLEDAMASTDSELGIVHLTLTDLRSGAEHFDRLLISNGVQVLAEPAGVDRLAAESDAAAFGATESNTRSRSAPPTGNISSRSGAAAGGMAGSAISENPSSESAAEMVLVEAPPAQIASILFSCSQDTEAIQEVSIDPSAGGTNVAPENQKLNAYSQYQRGATLQSKSKDYNVTPAQQGMIAALNSLEAPLEQSEAQSPDLQNQGWATRFRSGEQVADVQKLSDEVNNRRNQFYSYAQKQSSLAKKLATAKEEAAAQPSMRVLFLLHPSNDSANK